MDVKEAALAAKEYLVDLFQGEGITDVGLEEVVFNDISNTWAITIGFSRPWDSSGSLAAAIGARHPTRSYKVVSVNDEDGNVVSLTDRVLPAPK